MLSRVIRHLGRISGHCLRTDVCAFALVLVSFAVGMALTWQRWGNPLTDCGREMNVPLRLLRGERLYGDISHIYGPLAPVVNAGLYRIFGVSLDTLRGAGAFAALVVLAATYWLARRLMGRAEAALSAIGVTWLCVPYYLLPYTYAAVYGVALSLLALAAAERGLRSGGVRSFFAAGLFTALAFLAKTEMGAAALAGGLTCVLLAGIPRWRETAWRAAAFLVPALALPIATYVWIASRVGWTPLLDEGHLLGQHLAQPMVNFYRQVFGLVHPWNSLRAIVVVALRLALVASSLSWLAMRLHAADDRLTSRLRGLTGILAVVVVASGDPYLAIPLLLLGLIATDDLLSSRLRGLIGVLAVVVVVLSLLMRPFSMRRNGDPYLAVPLLLLGLIGFQGWRLWKRLRSQRHARGRAALGLATAVFALASLARSIPWVSSDAPHAPYSPYLLPGAIVVFTYAWCALLPAFIPRARARWFLRVCALALLTCWIAGVALTTVRRQRADQTAALVTPRGVMMTTAEMQRAFAQALAFIESRTRPNDLVAVLPEGSALLFFSDRRNPLHEEITIPGFLNEDRAIHSLQQQAVALVLIADRSTTEYGPARFGRDYAQRLMGVIEDRFVRCGRLGATRNTAAEGEYFDAYCAAGVVAGASPAVGGP